MQLKDIICAPLYLYQGCQLKRTALRLPEATGHRKIVHQFCDACLDHTVHPDFLHIMLVGDSAAAGVGVDSQDEAVLGQLYQHLSSHQTIAKAYSQLSLSLHASSGDTSFDLLRRLYVLTPASQPVDVMVVIIGANDAKNHVTSEVWQRHIEQIISLSQRKFQARHIIFSCLPPMGLFPAIPKPLNGYIGTLATQLDTQLRQLCQLHDRVSYLDIDFESIQLEPSQMFARDGFHPNALTYDFWAQQIVKKIIEVLLGYNEF